MDLFSNILAKSNQTQEDIASLQKIMSNTVNRINFTDPGGKIHHLL